MGYVTGMHQALRFTPYSGSYGRDPQFHPAISDQGTSRTRHLRHALKKSWTRYSGESHTLWEEGEGGDGNAI